MRRALFVVLPFLLLIACGPGPEAPADSDQETPGDVTAVPDSVVGTYRLVAVDDEPLPGGVGMVDECEVQLSRGTITLGDDARYTLDVLARALCDADEPEEAQIVDRATSEGPFTVDSVEIRFISALMEAESAADTPDDEGEEDEEMEEPDLYDAALFSGTGTLRDTTLTVRIDEATTLTFTRE